MLEYCHPTFTASFAADLVQNKIEVYGSQPPLERSLSSKTSIVCPMHARVVIPSCHIKKSSFCVEVSFSAPRLWSDYLTPYSCHHRFLNHFFSANSWVGDGNVHIRKLFTPPLNPSKVLSAVVDSPMVPSFAKYISATSR